METSLKDRVRSKAEELHSAAAIPEAGGQRGCLPRGSLADEDRRRLDMETWERS